jgi:hypothetical protein
MKVYQTKNGPLIQCSEDELNQIHHILGWSQSYDLYQAINEAIRNPVMARHVPTHELLTGAKND